MAKKARTKPKKRRITKRPTLPDHAKQACDLVMRLMAIPGRSGEESEVSRFIIDELLAAGVPARAIQRDQAHRKSPLKGETGNIILKLPGTRRGPRRMFSAHMDTVPICVGSKPVRSGNRVRSADPATGLGGDDRAGCAVLLHTVRSLLKDKSPRGPLTFLWMVQEEIGLQGARAVALSKLGSPAMAFNFDGGSPDKLTIGATGGYRMAIEIEGIASHAGGAPEEGVSAITIAALAIADLHRGGWHGLINNNGRLGTSNVGVIRGGDATNVVTDRLWVKVEARSHDPVFRRRIVKEIEAAFRRAAREVKNNKGKSGRIVIEGHLDYESYRIPTGAPCVRIANEAIKAEGSTPEFAIANGGLDANWLNQHGISTVSLGCGQENIHTVKEELDLARFLRACRIAIQIATSGVS